MIHIPLQGNYTNITIKKKSIDVIKETSLETKVHEFNCQPNNILKFYKDDPKQCFYTIFTFYIIFFIL